ncbi:LysR substrate-binding domain-containing protein [Pseudoxanthobacter sp.]|uniref:LysR family transcriptional regulator n=1 Tax=Pseudoxanthobacter sp. TaxID=1925742 RepID=UPI002FDF867B
MNLEALDCFVKIAEVRSLSAAAKLHGLPKSTLSLKLRQLEADLGVALFAREGRGLDLTDAGTELLRHAQTILRSCESARSAVAEASAEVAGTLRIGATGEFGTAFNAQMLYAFRQRYPLVQLDLTFFSPSVLYTPDRLQGFDVIISWDDPGDGGYQWETLAGAAFALVASPSYLARNGVPQTPEDIDRDHRGVLYRRPGGLQNWRLQNGSQTADLLPRSDFIANDYWTVKYFAVAGEGIAFLPKFFTAIECERGHLSPVLPEWESEAKVIQIRYTRPALASRKLDAFVAFCKNYFAPGFNFRGPRYYVETVLDARAGKEGNRP